MSRFKQFLDEGWGKPKGKLAGWIAMYNGKKLEIKKNEAKDLYAAKQIAMKKLKVPKSKMGMLAIEPGYEETNEAKGFVEKPYRLPGVDKKGEVAFKGFVSGLMKYFQAKPQQRKYRNHKEFKEWDKLVDAGYAWKTEAAPGKFDYGLTDLGRKHAQRAIDAGAIFNPNDARFDG